jgi:hypothetical protein
MLEDALLDLTNRGDIVLDRFLGSGSTLIAADKTGRVCRGVELDPLYVDVIVRRFEAATDNQRFWSRRARRSRRWRRSGRWNRRQSDPNLNRLDQFRREAVVADRAGQHQISVAGVDD